MSHISARYQWIRTAVAVISLMLVATGVAAVTPWHIPPTRPSAPVLNIQPAPQAVVVELPVPVPQGQERPPTSSKEPSHTGLGSLTTYRIKPGDTLGRVANAWHTTVSNLAAINGIVNPNRIFPGLLIKRHGKPVTLHINAVHKEQSVAAVGTVPSGSVGKVIAFAKAQLGDPYVWGAAGPNAWDCSGLTMKAFAVVGISLPHSSRAQYTFGHSVSRANLRPGDLLFYGYSASSIHHVALYIGGGMVLHASTSGQPVKIVPIGRTGSDYFGARRLL